jgi:hypothetical protein
MAHGRRPGPLGVGWAKSHYHGHRPATAGFSGPGPIGGTGWNSALAQNEKSAATRLFQGREPTDLLKQRAKRGLPTIGKRIEAWRQGIGAPTYWGGTLTFGVDAAARNTTYTSMGQSLDPSRGRYWFQAAGMVTGRGGIKDMEGGFATIGSILPGVPSIADMRFVVSGNSFLYPYNLHNFFILRDKGDIPGFEFMRGDDLDRGLVVLEQTLVQTFIDAYSWPSAEEKTKSIARISKGFTRFFANDRVKEAITKLFPTSFYFGNIDHRIRLGIELVAEVRGAP